MRRRHTDVSRRNNNPPTQHKAVGCRRVKMEQMSVVTNITMIARWYDSIQWWCDVSKLESGECDGYDVCTKLDRRIPFNGDDGYDASKRER
mmetsp:Transcript_61534/g.150627  ORF Transcript_61534/g.150627 Transcript_61534/m.150627 type:complete len:91 (+) Transcript_61534:2489-2761(+)|eukprot:CAMPEP_0113445674 /NCGR_PEP_ID=MMETSP0014_2-20120614/3309_1 /TAXON_ID=2857 /ORGANISM="Nitzschia sp." /LENGTH=90 /DNA_ID=CAMNT_0000336735 /DNA_START=364 /DNA_END=636 /DNA_ORIENTATION=+ /assembly_acc=CAM_ASM_000159